jgi:hypothetical protein
MSVSPKFILINNRKPKNSMFTVIPQLIARSFPVETPPPPPPEEIIIQFSTSYYYVPTEDGLTPLSTEFYYNPNIE